MHSRNGWRTFFGLFFLLAAFLTQSNLANAENARFDLAQLKTPAGFHISVFAQEIDGPRMMVFSPGGGLLVTESGEGRGKAIPDPSTSAKYIHRQTSWEG